MDSTYGIKFSYPWIQVVRINRYPIKICLECDCRNIDCRLISFNSKGWKDFIDREGFQYFWFKNRYSINLTEKEYRGIEYVLRGYAFDNKQYSFINKVKTIE